SQLPRMRRSAGIPFASRTGIIIMNIRWLWFDHFPPELDVKATDRPLIIKRAHEIRKNERLNGVRSTFARTLVATLLPVAVVFILCLIIGPKFRSAPWRITSIVAAPLVFNGLVWLAITYSVFRVSGPFVRWALCEHGYPV